MVFEVEDGLAEDTECRVCTVQRVQVRSRRELEIPVLKQQRLEGRTMSANGTIRSDKEVKESYLEALESGLISHST